MLLNLLHLDSQLAQYVFPGSRSTYTLGVSVRSTGALVWLPHVASRNAD